MNDSKVACPEFAIAPGQARYGTLLRLLWGHIWPRRRIRLGLLVAGLIQSVSQAFLQWLRAWGEVGGIGPSQCSKALLLQPISI
jgi:hypothetical protein